MKSVARIERNTDALCARGYEITDAMIVATYLEDVRASRIARVRADARIAWRAVCILFAVASTSSFAIVIHDVAKGLQ
jgi:hypothetical protein